MFGNHSPTQFKKLFPNSTYHGVDININYNNSEEDLKNIDRFFEIDLTTLKLDTIPDNYYDGIIMAHVIEHLKNGDEVIKALNKKLKVGGSIYIEYPSAKSVNFPSKEGTLNFYDDPTHCRIYTINELTTKMKENGFSIVSCGTRRNLFNILILPLKIVHNKLKYKYVMGSVYWDLYGFAEYIWAKRN